MDVITRKEAKALGLKRYFTGKKCKHGHVAERKTMARDCVECIERYNKIGRSDEYKDYRRTYQKTEAYKISQKASKNKYMNATKSRSYYSKRKGSIEIKSRCENCNSQNRIEAHHHDYNLPLDVEFLCKTCHENWHKHNTPLNRESGIFTE
jgi:hypothetical protein